MAFREVTEKLKWLEKFLHKAANLLAPPITPLPFKVMKFDRPYDYNEIRIKVEKDIHYHFGSEWCIIVYLKLWDRELSGRIRLTSGQPMDYIAYEVDNMRHEMGRELVDQIMSAEEFQLSVMRQLVDKGLIRNGAML